MNLNLTALVPFSRAVFFFMDLCRPVAFAGFQTAGRLLLTPPLFGSMFTTFSLPDSEPSCHLGCLRLDLSAQLTSAPWRREGCCWRTGEIGGYGGVACCRSENPLASWRIEDLSPARVALLKTGGGKCFAFVRLQPVSLSYITQLTGRSTLATLRLGTVVPSVPAQEKHPPLPSAYPVRVRPVWIQPARFPACQPGSHLWKRGSRRRHPQAPGLSSPRTRPRPGFVVDGTRPQVTVLRTQAVPVSTCPSRPQCVCGKIQKN